MKGFQRILVGIALTPDGAALTTGSRRAALQAQWLAQRIGASVTFVHSSWSDDEEEPVRSDRPERARGALEGLLREYEASGAELRLAHSDERPWKDLVERVLRREGDIVFVARRNEPGQDRLGSVSRKLLAKCPAPVWVVKPDAPLVHARVLAATDLTPVGQRVLDYAAFVARAQDCELHVVHAWQVPMAVQMGRGSGHEHDRERLEREARERLEADVRRATGGRPATLHVRCDSPSRAILDGVEALDPDLLVMGTVSRTGVSGLLVGNTAEKLLDRVACSLLAVKPEGFVSPVRLD